MDRTKILEFCKEQLHNAKSIAAKNDSYKSRVEEAEALLHSASGKSISDSDFNSTISKFKSQVSFVNSTSKFQEEKMENLENDLLILESELELDDLESTLLVEALVSPTSDAGKQNMQRFTGSREGQKTAQAVVNDKAVKASGSKLLKISQFASKIKQRIEATKLGLQMAQKAKDFVKSNKLKANLQTLNADLARVNKDRGSIAYNTKKTLSRLETGNK